MQAPDDVKLRNRFCVTRGRSLESFLESHGVGSRRVFFSAEGAQTASGNTNIGGIDMAVDVEICPVAVHSLAHGIGHPSDSEDIAAAVKGEPVLRIKALPGKNLFRDRLKLRVVCLKRMRLKRMYWHSLDDNAAKRWKSQPDLRCHYSWVV